MCASGGHVRSVELDHLRDDRVQRVLICKVTGIQPVHISGGPADMTGSARLCKTLH
jgi:hypothetical protein